jgi:hypothetical protein
MPRLTSTALLAFSFFTALAQSGCRDDAAPPPHVAVPTAANRDLAHERDSMKPMPSDEVRPRRDSDSSISVEPPREPR